MVLKRNLYSSNPSFLFRRTIFTAEAEEQKIHLWLYQEALNKVMRYMFAVQMHVYIYDRHFSSSYCEKPYINHMYSFVKQIFEGK